jgi:tripartite ATP-independent transporter DctP family solute receptor
MKRKGLQMVMCLCLIAATLALGACGGSSSEKGSSENSSSGSGAGTISLRLGHADTQQSVFHAAALVFKEALEKESKGSISVGIYPSSQLGTLREMTEALQMGTLDFAPANSAVLSNFVPEIGVFDLPFVFDDFQHAYRALDGSVGEFLTEKMAAQGLKVLGYWEYGGFRNVTANKPIPTLESLKGLRVRIMTSNIYRDIFLALETDPVPMDWSETFTALQQGTVDGEENPFAMILDAKIYEVNKYVLETKHTYGGAAFMMAPKTWDKLTAEQKAAVVTAAKTATTENRKFCEEREISARKQMIEQYGLQVAVPKDMQQFREKVKSVYEKYSQLTDLVKQIDSYRK